MKNKYLLILLVCSALSFGQQKISFEASEGFKLGSINTQNDWEVTEGKNGFIQNQVISDEKSNDGIYSFKNAYESSFNDQWFPIFGATKVFDNPIDHSYFTISYDIFVTEQDKSDFEFMIFSINADEEYVPVAGVGIENRGYIYFTKDTDYDFEYAKVNWVANTWVNIKIEVTKTDVKYYVNNVLDFTVNNFSNLDVHGFYMLHNNYGADAYYDNIQISTNSLSINDPKLSSVKLYPNPTKGIVNFDGMELNNFSKVEVFDLNGRKISENKVDNIDLSKFSNGTYLIKATTVEGKSITKKVIKN